MAHDSDKRIEDFLQIARSSTLPITTQQIIAAHELLMRLRKRGEWPEDIRGLGSLLAPVLCSAPAEQVEFHRRFEHWLAAEKSAPLLSPLVSLPSTSERPKNKLKYLLIVVAVIFVLVGFRFWITRGAGEKVVSGLFEGAVIGPDHMPIRDMTVRYRGKVDKTDDSGRFSIAYKKEDIPFSILISGSYWNPALLRITNTAPAPAAVSLSPREGVEFRPGAPVRANNSMPSNSAAWIGHQVTLITAVAFLLPFAVTGFHLWWQGRSLILRKWSTPLQPKLRRFGTERFQHELFPYAQVQPVSTELTRHQPQPAGDLDVERSLDKTLRSGGLFTPVFASRRARPEYLCLIQQLSSSDHYTLLNNEMFDQLEAAGVNIDRYYYVNDPGVCWATGRPGNHQGFLSLQELAAIYPAHHLCVFGEIRQFIDPSSLRPNFSAEMLQHWRRSTIIDGPALCRASEQCHSLHSLGVQVLEDRLECLAELAEEDQSASVPVKERRFFPPLLEELPERWLSRHSPVGSALEKLNAQLRIYLEEDGYLCLQACAVYPGLIWALTVFLTQQFTANQRTELILGKLARLPWFRYATMPDWLRLRLLRSLPDSRRDDIRKALDQFLEAVTADHSVGQLTITEQRPGAEMKLSGGPLHDFVFASFILGQSMDQLGISAPRRFATLLKREIGYAQAYSRAKWGANAYVGSIALYVAIILSSLVYSAASSLKDSWKSNDLGGQQPATLTAVNSKYTPPSDPEMAAVIDIAAAQIGQPVSGVFVEHVLSTAEDVLGIQGIEHQISIQIPGRLDRKLLTRFPFVLKEQMSPSPGLVSFAQNAVVESNQGPNTGFIKANGPDSIVQRLSQRFSLASDLWNIKTGEYLSAAAATDELVTANNTAQRRSVLIKTSPGTQITIDGKVIGYAGQDGGYRTLLAPGRHRIDLNLEAYSSWSQTVMVTNVDLVINAELTIIPQPPPSIVSFISGATRVQQGSTVELHWEVQNAKTITIDQGIGNVSSNGSKSVSPTAAITYTLTAKGDGGIQTRSVFVNVTAPQPMITSFNTDAGQIQPGVSVKLFWSTQNATEVLINPDLGPVPASGSAEIKPSKTTTFTLTANGAGGTATRQTQVIVESAQSTPTPLQESDIEAIKDLIAQFKRACDSGDSRQMQTLWATDSGFAAAPNLSCSTKVTWSDCNEPSVTGGLARVGCGRLYWLEPPAVGPPNFVDFDFTLSKKGKNWYISDIKVR